MASMNKPKDITTWWMWGEMYFYKPNGTTPCAYCVNVQKGCADHFREFVELATDLQLRAQAVSIIDESGWIETPSCGSCGCWCHNCSRFWATHVEGEGLTEDYRSADDATLGVGEDGRVICTCGTRLWYDPMQLDTEEADRGKGWYVQHNLHPELYLRLKRDYDADQQMQEWVTKNHRPTNFYKQVAAEVYVKLHELPGTAVEEDEPQRDE